MSLGARDEGKEEAKVRACAGVAGRRVLGAAGVCGEPQPGGAQG
jgi:hypothetical protein